MKEISFHEINKIKRLQEEIFEIEDDDYVNRRQTSPKYRAIDRILNKYTQEEQLELRQHIKWHQDECYKKLQSLGWIITTKGGNPIYNLHKVEVKNER